MKFVSCDAARATVLFPIEEILPLDGFDSSSLFDAIAARYEFSLGPDLAIPREERASIARFESGCVAVGEDGKVDVYEFSIFADGFVVGSSRTEHAVAFVADLMEWLCKEHGFRQPSTVPETILSSQLVVEFEKPLSGLIKLHDKIGREISDAVGNVFGAPVPMQVARIDFGFDSIGLKAAHQIPSFYLERRAGAPYSSERYFSLAPMSTVKHLETLEAIEKLIK